MIEATRWRGRVRAFSNAARMIRSQPRRVKTAVWMATSSSVPWYSRPPTLAYSPSVFSRKTRDVDRARSLVAKRARHAGIKIARAEADALVEPPANGQQEPVKRDVVLDLRMADRSQQNGVVLRQRVEKIGRSHPAVGEVVVRSPGITGPLERGVLACGGRVGGADGLRGDLRPDPVPFDDGDLNVRGMAISDSNR